MYFGSFGRSFLVVLAARSRLWNCTLRKWVIYCSISAHIFGCTSCYRMTTGLSSCSDMVCSGVVVPARAGGFSYDACAPGGKPAGGTNEMVTCFVAVIAPAKVADFHLSGKIPSFISQYACTSAAIICMSSDIGHRTCPNANVSAVTIQKKYWWLSLCRQCSEIVRICKDALRVKHVEQCQIILKVITVVPEQDPKECTKCPHV